VWSGSRLICTRQTTTNDFQSRHRARLTSRSRIFSADRASISENQPDPRVHSAEGEALRARNPFQENRGPVKCPTDGWESSTVSGTAKIAADHGLDIVRLSRAYGMVLGRQMLQLGIDDLVPERIIDGIAFGGRNEEVPMDIDLFESKIQNILDGSANDSAAFHYRDPLEMIALSQMYGYLLGTALRMSCLELNESHVADGFRAVIVELDVPMPLDPEEYDRQFMELQQIAAALMHQSNLADADRFFGFARCTAGIASVRADGLILFQEGIFRAPDSDAQATSSDTVHAVVAGRLLDGRSFLVPTFSDGVDCEADAISIPLAGVPEALSVGIIGMRPGEVRTVFIHPEANDGISALFSAQPFPPQSTLIFDFKLLSTSNDAPDQERLASESQDAVTAELSEI
jgi:hypothetical protein